MSRSPSRDRSTSRAGRTLVAAAGGDGGGGDTSYPTTLTGKSLWLRAKDLGTGSVGTWTNAASVASDPVTSATAPTIATASTPSGGKSVLFAGASLLSLPTVGGRGSCSASSIFAAGYEAANAVEPLGATWACASLPATWQIELTEAETLTAYRIYPTSNANQQPASWTFQGSNNGTTWTTLDTRSGLSPTGGAWNSYSFSNTTAYKVYKFVFTAAVGAGSIVNILEIELGGVANLSTQTAEVWAVVKSAGNGTFQGIWHLGGDSGTGASYYPYSGTTTVYEGAFLDDAIGTSYTHSLSVTAWRLYRVRNNGTTWQAWIDNTSQLTRASQPATYSKAPLLGKNRAGWFFNGNIAEILYVKQALSAPDVAGLITYFNTEHGLTVT